MKKVTRLSILAGIFLFVFACSRDFDDTSMSKNDLTELAVKNSSTLTEDFESGSKTAYASASVTLGTGAWTLNDALIGTSSSDIKNGTQSVRVRNTGTITMNFDYAYGAGAVTVKHALYGSDGSSTWELYYSTNAGSSWTKTGSTITTSSSTLQTASFTVNTSGNIRFEIRKISGGTNRINIDDFTVAAYSSGSSGGSGGSGSTGGADGDHMAFGNPSNATAVVSNENNYLMQKTYYALSYNRSRACPNWVSWYVNSASLGSTARQDDFRADATLPSGWYQVGASSYSGSGFDRGHNCPSGDRTSSVAANSATFLMSNMIPQAPNNNQQTWGNLEDYGRTLVNAGNEIYIIMGSYGTGGTGSNGYATTINNGNVTVPNRIWKVIVVLPNGTNDVARVTTSTRIIAINTPNDNSISSVWGSYRTSVDAIEAATGYDLLSGIADNVESVVEAAVDNGATN